MESNSVTPPFNKKIFLSSQLNKHEEHKNHKLLINKKLIEDTRNGARVILQILLDKNRKK
jgi:hypothetical protein